MWAALTPAYAKLPACLQRLRERLKSLPNEKRPGRTCDRVVKSRHKRYSVRHLKKILTERHYSLVGIFRGDSHRAEIGGCVDIKRPSLIEASRPNR